MALLTSIVAGQNLKGEERSGKALVRERAMFEGDGKWHLGLTLAISIGLHVVLAFCLSRVIITSLTVSDLTFQEFTEPPPRVIPRPRHAPREAQNLADITEIKDLRVPQRSLPPPEPIKTEPPQRSRVAGASFAGLTDAAALGGEKIDVPVVPGSLLAHGGSGLGQWTPKDLSAISGSGADYSTPQSYLEMVRLKIERHKKYPEEARTRRMEGRVTVRFVITPEGDIRDTAVVKSSRQKALDEAALLAVQNASPFPRPPARHFKGSVPLTVTVVFELM
jgi:protein TonB